MSGFGRVGIIGLGNMGGAIADGLVRAGWSSESLIGWDPSDAARASFPGVPALDAADVAARSAVCILAIKPQLLGAFAASFPVKPTGAIWVSVLAGVPVASLREALPGARAWVRAMPNTSARSGRSATGLWVPAEVDPPSAGLVREVFGAVGEVFELVREDDLHAFTALAGSGPAFAAVFAEALADGAVREGMSRAMARRVAGLMLAGAAESLLASDESPAALKDRVASPGGTTIAGLLALEAAGFRHGAAEAIRAACARSRELAGPVRGGGS